jgi:hypothetical protein
MWSRASSFDSDAAFLYGDTITFCMVLLHLHGVDWKNARANSFKTESF